MGAMYAEDPVFSAARRAASESAAALAALTSGKGSASGGAATVWRLDGQYYDLAAFAAKHPGGGWAVELSEGHDVTHLFYSYHAACSLGRLKAYHITEPEALARAQLDFVGRDTSPPADAPLASPDPQLPGARATLEAATGLKMCEMKPPLWGWLYYLITGAVYVAACAAWYHAPTTLNGIVFGAMGWIFAGFIQHEGSHAALSRSPLVNCLGRYAIIPWASPKTWFVTHVVQHHPCVNTGMDPDFQSTHGGVVRHHTDVPWEIWHAAQIASVHVPVVSLFYSLPDTVLTVLRRGTRWGESLLYVLVVLGMFGGHYSMHGDVLLCLMPQFAFSLCFITVTQWSHIQECCVGEAVLPTPPKQDFIGHQVRTCCDYSHGNLAASALSIFLNYQTYHHVFPGVSHFRYFDPRVKRAVDEWLVKSGLPLPTGHRTMASVVGDYIKHIRTLALPSTGKKN